MTYLRPIGLNLGLLMLLGCAAETSEEVRPASMKVRVERRAFPGAPPVIPHARLGGACVTCHTGEGNQVMPKIGIAPANPHLKTLGMTDKARCEQCHVFQQTENLFVKNEFKPFILAPSLSEPAPPHAPPTIPHPVFMREDCTACHAGAAARPEIRCNHADRKRCQQCHVPHETAAEFPVAGLPENRPATKAQ